MKPKSYLLRHKVYLAVLCFSVIGICDIAFGNEASAQRRAVMPSQHAEVFKTYCYDCHDAQSQEGSVNLEEIPFEISSDIETAERWAKILNAINSGEMPPENSAPISDEDKTSFLDDLSKQMVTARKILSDSGGVITMRRLNRREYQNTVEELLGLRPDVSTLPDDQATSGFDTAGASLFFSSNQLEEYLAVARRTLELTFRESTAESKTIRVEPEEVSTPHYQGVEKELQDRIDRANAYIANQDKPAADFGFLDMYQAKRTLGSASNWLPQIQEYLQRPETTEGVALILTIKFGGTTKVKMPSLGVGEGGKYTIRLRAAMYPDAPERFHYVEFTSGNSSGRSHLGWRKVTGTLDNPQLITFPIEHKPGEKNQVWIHQRSHQDRGDKNLWTIDQQNNGIGTPPGVWIDWAELTGPEPNQSSKANEILFEKPKQWSHKKYVREVLHRFATRAFRGEKPDPDFLDRLVGQYDSNIANGKKHREAIVDSLAIILSSPSFLYMVESTGNGSSLLTQNELAVRLSYFLWSEAPDEDLLEVARSGKLSDPATLRAQTSRMLADEKAGRFVRGFVHQWLQMERLDMFQFHGVRYPTFDNAVRANARDEIYETILLMMKEQLPLHALLKSDFVVINDLLAGYYGLPEIKGHEFRKVNLPADSIRGGLLGTAAIHAMGSDGLRSSPVERGAWVLRHLLNDPPPPAPPNVPQLSRLAGEVLGARELQKAHQEEPQCAQCHRKIDPIGYGLENFNAAGLWRNKETLEIGNRKKGGTKDFDIDPSGKLPNGEVFTSYAELRDGVANYADEFARGHTEALIAYGLGRPYGFTDQDLADEMVRHAKSKNYAPNAFIHALIQSKQFRSK
jgi:mono/diheme cytochrome c family protein